MKHLATAENVMDFPINIPFIPKNEESQVEFSSPESPNYQDKEQDDDSLQQHSPSLTNPSI